MTRSIKTRARQAAGELLFRAGYGSHPGGTLAVLMYHAVTPVEIRDGLQLSVSAAQFDVQMAMLRTLDVDVVSLADGVQRLGTNGHRLAVSVVFDDGFVGVHDYACEILVHHRIPSTVFVTTEWVGRSTIPGCERSLGRPLTWDEVRALMKSGNCAIGSHSATHAVLSRLSSDELHGELRRSGDAIADATGHRPCQFAYPFGTFGTFDARTRDAVVAAGFHIGCTTVWGVNGKHASPLELRRLRVSWCDSSKEVRKAIGGCYEWYRVVQFLQGLPAAASRE